MIGVRYDRMKDMLSVETDEADGFADQANILSNGSIKSFMKDNDIGYVESDCEGHLKDTCNEYFQKMYNTTGKIVN